MIRILLVFGVLVMAGTFYSKSMNTVYLNIWTEQPSDVTVCGGPILFTVHVQNIGMDDVENIKVYPQMPSGMIYVPGTARYQGGALLSEIGPTGNSPGFILPNSLGVTAGTNEAVITFEARASCAILAYIGSNASSLVNNTTKVEFNLRTEGPTNVREEFEPNGSTSYNVLSAAIQYFIAAGDDNLSLTSPTQVFNRTMTITNSGTGALDRLSLYAEFDENLDYQRLYINVSGSDVELTPSSVSTTSVRYDIDLLSLGLSFNPNDQLIFKDEVMAASFKPSIVTKYYARWGCDVLECNSASLEAAYLYIVSSGFPNMKINGQILNATSIDLCDDVPATSSYLIENLGSGNTPEILDAAFDVKVVITNYSEFGNNIELFVQPVDQNNNDVGPRINISGYINFSLGSQLSIHTVEFSSNALGTLFQSDFDGAGGFEDLDSDGFYDDIAPGGKVKIIAENTLRLLSEVDISDKVSHIRRSITSLSLNYTDWEGDLSADANLASAGFSLLRLTRNVQGDPDFLETQETAYTFDFTATSAISKVSCSDGIYEAVFELPQGFEITSILANDEVVPLTALSVNGNIATLRYLNTDRVIGVTYQVGITINDCNTTSGNAEEKLGWKLFYLCDPLCSDGRYRLADEQVDVINHCNQCTTLETTDVKVERTTLGWVDTPILTYSYGELFGNNATANRVTAGTPGIALNAAYPYDNVEVMVQGTLSGTTAFDNVGVEIEYESPIATDLFRFLDGEFKINGVPHTANAPTVTTDVSNSRRFIYRFILTGVTLNPQDDILFTGNFEVNEPSTPTSATYNTTLLGRIFGNDGTGSEQGCEAFGQQFKVIRPIIEPNTISRLLDCDNKLFLYYRINFSGTQFDDFPNEFRPVYYINDLTCTLPTGFEFDPNIPVLAFVGNASFPLTNISYTPDRTMITIGVSDEMPLFDLKTQKTIFRIETNVIKNRDYVPTDASVAYPISASVGFYPNSDQPMDHSFTQADLFLYFRDRQFNDVILTANSVQEAIQEKVNWPVQLCNNTQRDVQIDPEFNWISVELRPEDESTILEAAFDDQGNALPVIHYGPSGANAPAGKHMFIEVGSLPQGRCKNISFQASYVNCVENAVQGFDIYSSYDCDSYPFGAGNVPAGSVLGVHNGEQPLQQIEASIIYKNADLQWTVNQEGPSSTDICTPVPFIVDLFSVLHADMSHLELLVDLPDTYTTVESAEFLYPANAGSGAAFTPAAYTVLPSGRLKFDVTGTDILNGALPGFQSGENNVRFKIVLNTSCGFDPGLPVVFNVNGMTNCGDTKAFADQRKVNISGIVLDEVSVGLSLAGGVENRNDLTVTMINEGGTPTSEGEFKVILNSNIEYGSILGGDFTQEPVETVTSLGRELVWPMPQGFISPGETKRLMIDTYVMPGSGLNGEVLFYARTSMFGSASCGLDVCDVNATTGAGNGFINIESNNTCPAGPDQDICIPMATMAASGTSGHWTQETGPSSARFSDSTSPISTVTLGAPGEYIFTWTATAQNCNGTDQVVIDYEPNFAVSILSADGRPVMEFTRGQFYDATSGVDSGVNYPLNGGGFYDGLAVDTKGNKLYAAADVHGLWVLDRNTNHGELITTGTAVPSGDKYNQQTRSLFVDEKARVLYASGWPSGTNAGALWRYDLVTGEGTAFYPGYLPPGGGDPFPNGIGDEVRRVGDKVYVSVYRFNSAIPDGGVYIYDETSQSGKFLTPENTTTGGAYAVQGDPMPSNKCHTTAYTLYKGKEYLFVGFQFNEIWEFNITDNTGRVLTPGTTASNGAYAVDGDAMPETDVFNLKLAGSLLMSVNATPGIWLYDFDTNQGKHLTRENTLPGGKYEVAGDAIPNNAGVGLEYDPEKHRLFAGFAWSKDPALVNVLGAGGGIWEYDLLTGAARLHKVADVGVAFQEFWVRPLTFDGFGKILYSSSSVEIPGGGIAVYDLRDGITICNGETVTLRANIVGNSGVTYQWNENGVPVAGATNATYSTSTPGYYTVTATLSGGCYAESDGFIVREAPFDNLSVTPNGTWEVCAGGSTVLTATAGYVDYQWFRDAQALTGATTDRLTVPSTEPGTYTVQATTIEGCTGNAVDSVTIAASTLSFSYASSFDTSLGRGSIDLTISGGVGPYTYEWSGGLADQEDHINTLLPGIYSVSVTDAAGCTALSGPIVIGWDHCTFSLSANVTPDDGSGNGTINLSVSGGTGPFTYGWNLGLPSQQDQIGLRKGIYRVTVSDGQGCSQRLSIVVRGADECQNIISYHSFAINASCHDKENGLIVFVVMDGVPPYDYSLFDVLEEREVTQEVSLVPFSQDIVLFTGLKPSQYIVSVRNQECEFFDITDTGGLVVGSPEPIEATFSTTGDTGAGDGSIDLTVTGGTAPYSYAWPGGLPAVADHTGNVSTGVYEVTITDVLGCQVTVDDIFVENANNCSPDHPQRFTVQLLNATESVCDDGSTTADMTVRLDFANTPPFPGVTYTLRLMDATGFNYFENTQGAILQEFTGITISADPFDFTFTGISVTPVRYAIVVMADGVTPAQHPTCLYGSYGFAANITIETDPLPDASFRFRYPLIKVGDEVEAIIEEFVPGYSYTFDWNDGNTTVTSHRRLRHLFTAAGEYNVTLTAVSDKGCISQTTQVLRVFDYICESPVPDNGGQFYVDSTTGKIVFRRAECPGNFLLSCVSATAQPNIFDNAVAASAVTYDDQWGQDPLHEASRGFDEDANVFERGVRGKWRVKNSYAFKVPLQESDKNFNAGTFRLEDFSWRYEDANNPSKWIRSTTVERYSPDGEAIQERNALGIPSAAKFGYQGALPYLTAQNAEYQDVHFESFEQTYRDRLEDNVSLSDNGIVVSGDIVHAGTKSARLNGMFKLPAMHLSDQLVTNGLLMKVWIHAPLATQLTDLYCTVLDKNGLPVSSTSFNVVASVGQWKLLEATVNNFGTLAVGDFRENSDVLVPALENRGIDPVWIDDLRYQPADAEMTTYVYDPRNFRLLTVFDDQHFGLYYQYNAEGKLVRKRIETERGVKTIQETQVNQPKVNRGE